MSANDVSQAAKAVVRRNTDEVQGKGNFDLFEQLFADDFVDHTPQPGGTPDKSGARKPCSLSSTRSGDTAKPRDPWAGR